MKRDIRDNLPRSNQTNPNKFPAYDYKPYPRMMTREESGRVVPYRHKTGKPVIVKSKEEEDQFLESVGQVKTSEEPGGKSVDIPVNVAPSELKTSKTEDKPSKNRPRNLD